jgi:hypothetical protein
MMHALGADAAGEMQSLARALNTTDDRKLSAVVSLIERLPKRAAMESLLESVRPRLWSLKPPRPLSLRRVMAVPFEALLAESPLCPPDGVRVPRSLLGPLFAVVEPRLDAKLRGRIESACQGASTTDVPRLQALGQTLWPAASVALHEAFLDPRGTSRALADAGLDPGPINLFFPQLILALRHGDDLADALLPRDGRPPDPSSPSAPHRKVLLGAARMGISPYRLITASFLLRAPAPDFVVRMIAQARQVLPKFPLFEVVEEVTASLAAELGFAGEVSGMPAHAMADRQSELALRLALILSELSRQGSQADHLAAAAAQALSMQFGVTIDRAVLGPIEALASAGAAETGKIAAIESAARAAKRMEMAARAMGRVGGFVGPLALARARITELAKHASALADQAGGAVALPDLVRLVEILAGPDEALAMVESLAAE